MARILIALTLALSSWAAPARDLDKLYEKTKMRVGSKTIDAYIADDDLGREHGLMYVTSLPENTGMLFVFESERPLGFWMKNTLIPLAIGFFDKTGKLVDIQEMEVASAMDLQPPSYRSRSSARFALEMNKAWFAKNKIKVGDRLKLSGPVKSPLLKSALPSGK